MNIGILSNLNIPSCEESDDETANRTYVKYVLKMVEPRILSSLVAREKHRCSGIAGKRRRCNKPRIGEIHGGRGRNVFHNIRRNSGSSVGVDSCKVVDIRSRTGLMFSHKLSHGRTAPVYGRRGTNSRGKTGRHRSPSYGRVSEKEENFAFILHRPFGLFWII